MIVTQVMAQEAVQPINKGSAAPFTGILFPEKDAQDLRKELIELDTTKLLNESLQKSLSLEHDSFDHQQAKINLLLDQNDKLAERVYKADSFSTWEKIGWFGLGILTTGLCFYGLKKIQTSN